MTYWMTRPNEYQRVVYWCRNSHLLKEKKQENIIFYVDKTLKSGSRIPLQSDYHVMKWQNETCTYFALWYFHVRVPLVYFSGEGTQR